MKKYWSLLCVAVLLGFALACSEDDLEDLVPKAELEVGIDVEAEDVFIVDGELELGEDLKIDSGSTFGTLVADSMWTVENVTCKEAYPEGDNQITFIDEETFEVDWGGVAAIRTGVGLVVAPITCRLFKGVGGLYLYLEFERGSATVSSTVHVLVSDLDEMTWVGYENVSIFRRVQ